MAGTEKLGYVLVIDNERTRELLNRFPGWGIAWQGAGRTLFHIYSRRLWELCKQHADKCQIIPQLWRSAKRIPDWLREEIEAQGKTIDADDSVGEVLVKLTGDDDFARD